MDLSLEDMDSNDSELSDRLALLTVMDLDDNEESDEEFSILLSSNIPSNYYF
mgnify:CR=1 FL=1